MVVHMKDGDLVFKKKRKLYVTDFREWICRNVIRESERVMVLSIFKGKGGTLTKVEERSVEAAHGFVRVAGFPSEQEAVNMTRDGNFDVMPIQPRDIKASVREFDEHVSSVRGKMTN